MCSESRDGGKRPVGEVAKMDIGHKKLLLSNSLDKGGLISCSFSGTVLFSKLSLMSLFERPS